MVLEYKTSGFNIFQLISQKWQYENFHSDILANFLDKDGHHGEGNCFMGIFIDLLFKIKPLVGLVRENFKDYKITREKHRIDILIHSHKSKKVIIIENKIKNARDTDRQLPKYVKKVGVENVIAIVYIPLDENKKPLQNDWTEEEILFIESKLIYLPVYNKTELNLHNGWLLPAIVIEKKNEETTFILKQYSKLIKEIGGIIMDKNLYEKFYTKILEQKGFYESALSIKELMEELNPQRAEKIYNKYLLECMPFKSIEISNDDNAIVVFSGFTKQGKEFQLRIDCNDNDYFVRFYDTDYENSGLKNVSKIIAKLSDIHLEENGGDEFVKKFAFPNEEVQLYNFITKFKNELKTI